MLRLTLDLVPPLPRRVLMMILAPVNFYLSFLLLLPRRLLA